jgi:hypothetical protein
MYPPPIDCGLYDMWWMFDYRLRKDIWHYFQTSGSLGSHSGTVASAFNTTLPVTLLRLDEIILHWPFGCTGPGRSSRTTGGLPRKERPPGL